MTERAIFEAAIEIADATQRAAFLEEACEGDATLRERIDALLASHAQASQFLNVPAVEQIQSPPLDSTSPTVQLPPSHELPHHRDDDSDSEMPSTPDLSFLQPSSKPGSIGVLGHYEVLKVLGQGGFGIVLKAFDEKLHRHVAIKVMSAQMAATSPPRKRFLREARAAAAIRHENIVQVYSVEEQPLPYLVMEFIDGQTLQQKQADHGPLEASEWLHIGRQIAAGLASAHATGLIHRDIKPGNILIEEQVAELVRVQMDGEPNRILTNSATPLSARVKITDFGLARAADDASLSRSGTISGTPMYMAPEQALGQTLDHRADLFSMGSVLYELATGRPPFRAANTIAVLRRVVDDTPRPMQEIIPELSNWLVVIVNKLLAKNPDERFQSAKEVADLLGRCQLELQLSGQVTCVNVAESLRDSKPESRSDSATYAKTLNYKSPRLREDSGDIHGKGESRTSDSARSAGSNSTKPPQAKRSVWKVALIAMAFAVLSVFPLARLMKPAIDAWMWPPIPKLAETDVAGGLRFDGKDDYVKVGRFDFSSPQYTLEAFVTSAGDGDNGVIALLKSDGNDPELLHLYDGYPAKERQSGAGIIGQRPYQNVNAPLVNNTREHRALVVDGQVMHYFVNGIWQGKRYCAAHKGLMWQMRELYISCKANETEFFRGRIDQLRLSKIARYSSNFAPVTSVTSDDSTLALYNFDEGEGDVLKDASGNRRDGKIVGATWVKPKSSLSPSPSTIPLQPSSWHGWPADAPPAAIAPFDAAKAQHHQEAWAKYLGVPVEYTNSLGMKFRLIPPGEFLMGSTKEEVDEVLRVIEPFKNANPPKSHWGDPRWENMVRSELPQHRVVLTQPFYLGQHEVTRKDYESFSEKAESTPRPDAIAAPDTAMHPAVGMSWEDAAEFCSKLSAKEQLKPFYFRAGELVTILDGQGYRLPTEAEWEFACRSGTTTKYWSGDQDEDLHQVGWSSNSGGRLHAVGELKPSPFGLYDIHGNAWEWCQDWWDPQTYAPFRDQPAINPTGPKRPPTPETSHVSRGADWFFSGAFPCRSALRIDWGPRHHWFGFRAALSVDAVRQVLKVTGPAMPNGAKATASKFPPLAPGWFERVSKLLPEEQVKEVSLELKRRNPEWDEKLENGIRDGHVYSLNFDSSNIIDISPLSVLTELGQLQGNARSWSSQLTDLSPLAGMKSLCVLSLDGCTALTDLSPLRDLPISHTSLCATAITDLSPLAGKRISGIHLWACPTLTDLSPLKGAPLDNRLQIHKTNIRDLSPIRDSEVKTLILNDYQFNTDIVCGWPLKSISFESTIQKVPREKLLRLKEIKTLETIDGKPVAEFWKEFDKLGASKFPPLAPGWFERVSKLPPEEQVKEVSLELKRRNPEWDEKLEFENNGLGNRWLTFDFSNVIDITPLAALPWLNGVICHSSKKACKITDLSPLAGLKNLHRVDFPFCSELSDLSPLRDLPMRYIDVYGSSVTDLTPLRGKPIEFLNVAGCVHLTDLSPLQGAPLNTGLLVFESGIRDLSPVRESKITHLQLFDSQFDPDLVCHWALKEFMLHADLQKIPREKLLRLKEIKTLETINGKPVAEFWKEFDKTVGWHGWPADAPPPAIAPFDAEQAQHHQEAWAKYLGVPVEYTNSLGMKFRLIPPGEFLMGSTQEEIEAALKDVGEIKHWPDCIKSEAPQHKVILTLPVYLGVHEVTQAEYENVMGRNPSHFSSQGAGKEAIPGLDTTRHPVETVDWNDAAEFCAKLSQKEAFKPFSFRDGDNTRALMDGNGYQLPTEAEWEFACRAGTTTRFWIGEKDEDLLRAGWFDANSGGRTHAVGELNRNPFGMFDMNGNVWEWMQDWWGPTYYEQFHGVAALNPRGPSPTDLNRVIRGGHRNDPASFFRSSFRVPYTPTTRGHNLGIRVSLTVDAVRQALKLAGPAIPTRASNRPATPAATDPIDFAAERQVAEWVLENKGSMEIAASPDWQWRGYGTPGGAKPLPSEPFVITSLTMKNSQVKTESDLERLTRCRYLEDLTISGGTIDRQAIDMLTRLPRLKTLKLSDQKNLRTSALPKLGQIAILDYLAITSDMVDDRLEFVRHLPALRTLNIYGPQPPDITLLAEAPQLHTILLTTPDSVDDDTLAAVQARHGQLRIVVGWMGKYRTVGRDPVHEAAKHLVELGVECLGGVNYWQPRTKLLTKADFEDGSVWSFNVSKVPASVQLSADDREKLKLLDSYHFAAEGQREADELAKSLSGNHGIATITLTDCDLTEAGLEHLQKLVSLRGINVTKTKVTRAGVERFHRAAPLCAITSDFGLTLPQFMSAAAARP